MGKTSIYWGCTISNTLPYLIKTSGLVLKKIGIETREIDGWTCCPDPVSAKAYDHNAALALSARNMALAGDEMIVACSGCFNTFEKARKELRYPEKRDEINNSLPEGERYAKDVNIQHIMEVLHNKSKLIQNKVEKPLKGLKVAAHYGCHALWPQAVKSDHPDKPVSLDEMITTLGAESAEYENKMDCCGVPIAAFNTEESDRLLENKLKSAKQNADCMVTACPTCFLQFDRLSKDMREHAIPVFYITELIGLALGLSPEDMALNLHATSVQPVMEKLGIKYEEEKNIEEVKKYFDYIDLVSHCEACRLECTEARITENSEKKFDPLTIVEMVREGKLDEAIQDPMIWHCLQCGKCLSRCPNNIGLKDFFLKLREIAVERGKAPEAVNLKMDMILTTGYGMRQNEMIRRRLGMEPVKPADPEKIMKIIESAKKKKDGQVI
ncbi:MAG: heterodisulfide reductase-related iron-sulfur binding cluster [Candidatus Altiarchaeota archaeon]